MVLSGCAKQEPPASLSEITPQTAQPTEAKAESPQAAAAARAETAKPASPKPTEVRETLQRMFGKAVVIDESRNPYFVVGDFNGDGAQDLAIVVKPAAGMLSQINSEVANWIILDPQKTVAPDLKKGVTVPQKPLPVNVAQTDVLLAVIHGYGPTGWRSRETTQAFLLKRAVGSAMQARSLKEALQAAKIEPRRPVPQIDVITETIDSESGFLIWVGAKYAWYRPASATDTLAQNN
jgi:hypothetical protein